ncbi:hypothetical protein AR275_27270 [Stenotrophomonas maltophilia]|nr:hypothetical protein AR275_27270 [Stenotrophomonas maltophilia]
MKSTVLKHLARRWAEPRFRVFAHHSSDLALIGFARHSGDAESLGVAKMLTKFQGARLALVGEAESVYQVDPKHFLRLIWSLIDLNALIVSVRPLGKDALAPGNQWQDFWPDHVRSVAALRSRIRLDHASKFGELARCLMQDGRYLTSLTHCGSVGKVPRGLSETAARGSLSITKSVLRRLPRTALTPSWKLAFYLSTSAKHHSFS